jgi:ParB-like chromosome segregation protein Spo0J
MRIADMAKKKPKTDAPPPLRLEWLSPAELAENPLNWRTHPGEQLTALADVISEIGWAGAALYNERTGRLIDGHARKKIGLEKGYEKIPVLIGSWDEATEAKILASLDPIGAMATADAAKLEALLREVGTDSEALQQMLDDLARDAGIVPPEIASAPDPGPQIDRAAELQAKWKTETGQLWVIPSKTVPPRRVKICPHCQHKNPVK